MRNQRCHFLIALLLGLVSQSCRRAGTFQEIEVVGSDRFRNQVHDALLLLKTRDAYAYKIVAMHVKRIEEGERSGMWSYKDLPTYEMSDATAYYSVTWCASTIAHDSFHSKLYHEFLISHGGPVPDDVWTGTAAERQCMAHQLSVMEHIGASRPEIDWAKQQAGGNYAKDKENWRDYQKRNW
jgi:hypothetical protein